MTKIAELRTVNRQTLADKIYESIRSAIINGAIPEGAELNQVELAERFGVSRVPVREALRRLQAERLVVANPYQCYVVLRISPHDVLEMVELREELEVFALRKAMARWRAGELELEPAEAVVKSQSVRATGERWLETDVAFHRNFHASSVISAMIDELRDRVHRYFRVVVADPGRRAQVIDEHRRLLAAIKNDDEAEAVRILRAHIRATRELLAAHLGELEEGDAASDTSAAAIGGARGAGALGKGGA